MSDDKILELAIKEVAFGSDVKVGLRHALKSLKPNARGFICNDTEGILRWDGDENEQPSLSELESERDRLQLVYKNKEYQRNRALDYPTWQEQMDLIYHKGVEGLKAELKKTKDKYPKG